MNQHQILRRYSIWFLLALFAFALPTSAEAQISFAPAVQYNLPEQGNHYYPPCIVTADLNGDDRPDIAVCGGFDGPAGVGVFMNKGNGTLLAPLIYGTGSGETKGLAAIDLNQDGHPDLVALSNAIYVLLNRGDGTFLPPTIYPLSTGLTGGASLVAGDFNGDGKKEVAVSYYSQTVGARNAIYMSRGDGTLAFWSYFDAPPFPGYCCGVAVLANAADVNGDGIDDIITTERDNGFSVLLGQRNGFVSGPTIYTPNLAYAEYYLADVTGDGKLDILARHAYAAFAVLKNLGAGIFGPPENVYLGNYGYGMSLAIADFSRDGFNDVVSGPFYQDGRLYLFANNGIGDFATTTTEDGYVTGIPLLGSAVADFDGDGLLDVAYYDGFYTVSVLRNTTRITAPVTTVTAVFPNHGGNGGTVSAVRIVGTAIPSNVGIKLSGPGPDINATNIQVSPAGNLVTVLFNLKDATPGSYSLVLTKPDGTILLNVPAAFTIEQGGAPNVWVDVIGRNIIRGGRSQVYFLQYGNRGNMDAGKTRLWIMFPSFMTWRLTIDQSVIGHQGDNTFLAFDVPAVPAGATSEIPVLLSAPDTPDFAHRRFDIRAWKDKH